MADARFLSGASQLKRHEAAVVADHREVSIASMTPRMRARGPAFRLNPQNYFKLCRKPSKSRSSSRVSAWCNPSGISEVAERFITST